MGSDKKGPMAVSRRGFLGLTGAGATGLAVSGCSPRGLADFLELTEEDRRVPGGPERWVTSVCGQCDGGCSIRVRTVGDRAVGVTGNPLYPLNRGGLCPKGLAGLQALYDPDRVRGPLRRVGARGEGRWESIAWDEAIGSVAQTLREIRERGEAHTVAFLSGECRGLMDALIARFCRAYGTPNDVRKASRAVLGQALARHCTQGTHAPLAYDLEHTNYLLSFGAPLLDAYVSPVHWLRAYGELRQGPQGQVGRKPKIVQIEPRLSVTAAEADEWVPVNPGTEGALALGIAYVLIREGLYDAAFVASRTFGFDDWQDASGRRHAGFKRLVLEEHHTDETARITGVPVATILRIAKEFASHRPAVALGEMTASNAVYSAMAVHALNALVGSIDVPGGVVFPREVPLKALPEVELDGAAAQGIARVRLDGASTRSSPLARDAPGALPEAILEGKPYRANALFLYYTNPLFSSPEPARVRRAFEKVPLIVSFSPFLDESAAYADLILPDHTYLERWQDDPAPLVGPYTLLGLRQPVVKPRHDTMHTGDVLLKLAHALGDPVARSFPWSDFPEALRHSLSGVFEARRGAIVERYDHKPWAALLQERGWWYPTCRTFEEFWAQLAEKGGWWDPTYYFGEWDRIFQTPSGRFEFYSTTLERALAEAVQGDEAKLDAMLTDLKLAARGDRAYLPHFEPPRRAGDEGEYPLQLHVMRLMPLSEGRNAEQPFLQEIVGPHVHVRWDSWVEINPQTARALGIADGDPVWVESAVGKVETQARLYPGAMPGVVNMPANLGHTQGRWAKGIGANPMELAANEHDRLAGLAATAAIRVRVRKA